MLLFVLQLQLLLLEHLLIAHLALTLEECRGAVGQVPAHYELRVAQQVEPLGGRFLVVLVVFVCVDEFVIGLVVVVVVVVLSVLLVGLGLVNIAFTPTCSSNGLLDGRELVHGNVVS